MIVQWFDPCFATCRAWVRASKRGEVFIALVAGEITSFCVNHLLYCSVLCHFSTASTNLMLNSSLSGRGIAYSHTVLLVVHTSQRTQKNQWWQKTTFHSTSSFPLNRSSSSVDTCTCANLSSLLKINQHVPYIQKFSLDCVICYKRKKKCNASYSTKFGSESSIEICQRCMACHVARLKRTDMFDVGVACKWHVAHATCHATLVWNVS